MTFDLFTLANANGMEVLVTNYGATIVAIKVPDRGGRFHNVVLSYDTLASYLTGPDYLGAVIGRYANRIAGAHFTLDGEHHQLTANEGANHLHGGRRGFNKVMWHCARFRPGAGAELLLVYTSPDGEEGYPGTLRAEVRYTLSAANELTCEYRATTDRATHVNMTQHSYFNLTGSSGTDVLGHVLMINADAYTPVDAALIPTGEIRGVAGTPFDFREPTAIGARIHDADEQLRLGSGYDHNYVLRDCDGTLRLAARVFEPVGGRLLEISTTEPGLQFYSGNFLNAAWFGPRSGFALETQHFPDSPNQLHFPATVLRPGREYRTRTSYKFSVAS